MNLVGDCINVHSFKWSRQVVVSASFFQRVCIFFKTYNNLFCWNTLQNWLLLGPLDQFCTSLPPDHQNNSPQTPLTCFPGLSISNDECVNDFQLHHSFYRFQQEIHCCSSICFLLPYSMC
jgi:hypothetical protein